MQISKIEKLKSKVDKLEAKNTLLEAKKYALEVEMFDEIKSFVKKHYFPFIDDIEYSDNYFRLSNKERNEICSLSLRGESWRDIDLTQITLGYYSTQTKSNNHSELERLIALGTVSQVIQTRSDELLKDVKTLSMKNKNSIRKVTKEIYSNERSIMEIDDEIKNVNRERNLEKLFKGVHVDPCWVEVRNDRVVNRIKHIRFVNWTNDNKKSMKIHLIFEGSEWNYATKEYDSIDQSRTFDKVRIGNLDRFINDLEEYEAVEDKYIMT